MNKKIVTTYDLDMIFDRATDIYKNVPLELNSQQQRALSFLKAVMTYLQVNNLDYDGLVRKDARSIEDES